MLCKVYKGGRLDERGEEDFLGFDLGSLWLKGRSLALRVGWVNVNIGNLLLI